MPEPTIMDMELCADFIVNRTGIDKEIVKQVLKTETDYWIELDPDFKMNDYRLPTRQSPPMRTNVFESSETKTPVRPDMHYEWVYALKHSTTVLPLDLSNIFGKAGSRECGRTPRKLL